MDKMQSRSTRITVLVDRGHLFTCDVSAMCAGVESAGVKSVYDFISSLGDTLYALLCHLPPAATQE